MSTPEAHYRQQAVSHAHRMRMTDHTRCPLSLTATPEPREAAGELDFRSDTERDAAIRELLQRVRALEARLLELDRRTVPMAMIGSVDPLRF